MSASVKVAVRVRPFNDREINLHSQCVIDVVGNKTRLLNFKPQADDNSEAKEFTFDYSYWSHDHKSHHFASQEKVYNDLGSSVVSSGLQGYNACVFAYGQTGSGKTFTMMGSQSNPGLIPRICKALFSSMEKGTESGTTYKVEVSYLEIYNERVKDLLCAHPARDEHLKVREHKKFGPYVENLSKHIVTQYSDVQDLMQRGNSVRTTASTNMNDTSSRSHAIFTLTFVQAKLLADLPVETRSKINLVDLAGSERADATGATGQRLKEGSHINKSLVTLGTVISALADQGAKCNKKVHIPYRDSVLTFLLKDSLGGNSKTIMIATISPADVNFGETLGTLRYANRAKNIINTPTVNEDQNVKLIRELREEIAMLKKLAGGDANTGLPGVGESFTRSGDVSIRATLSLKEAQEKELTDKWTEKWRQTHKILQEQRTLELRQAGESGRGVVLDSERPHLLLYDDDLGSTGLILFHLNDELTTIGASEDQDIRIEGLGLEKEHCSIRLQGDGAVLETKEDAEVKVNDRLVEDKVELSHGAMIVVGSSHVFRYNDPKEAARIRKQGNRSSMNLSRLSFLSRSNTDLLRATDANANLGMPDLTFKGLESERRAMDDSSIPRPFTELSPECCEMSTQTSLPSYTRVGQDSMAPPWGGPPRPPDGSPRSKRVGDALLPSPGAAAGAATSTPKQEIRRIMGILDGPGNGCRPKKALEEHFKGSSDPVSQFANETRRSTDSNRIAESEASDLLPISSDLLRLNEVLVRLHSEEALANKSAEQQKKELKELQNYYTALENKILESQGQALPMTLDNRSHLTSEKWSSDLPLEVLLKEEKVVLLIESEVQRRLMDNMLRLSHKGSGTVNKGSDGGQGHDPMQRSSSASSLSFARTLSFNELRPYSSSSDIAPGDSQAATTPSSSLVPHVFPAHCRPSSSTQYSETDPEANSGIPYFIRIPFFELRGEGADAHCVYQVEVSVGGDVWCVFRRFRKFRELHLSMGRRHGAAVQDLYFPPRRIFGNHSLSVVQQRRKELESYLRQLVSLCSEMEGSPLCDHPPSRARLEEFSPFFCEALTDLRGQKL